MRPLSELLHVDDPAWPMVRDWIEDAENLVEVLPARDPDRADALAEVQVTVRSPMGAIVYETGGLLIDGGWLRVLGSGHPKLPRPMHEWNRSRPTTRADGGLPFWLIADDVVGGFFALDNGTLGEVGAKPTVFYFAPDSLRWEPTEKGYTDFLQWCLDGDLAGFYEGTRWPGWEAEVAALRGDQGISIYPFLFNEGPAISERSRRPVPIDELYRLHVIEFPRQIEDDDESVEFIVEPPPG